MASVSDNTAVMACESVMAILAREGCPELERIAARDYVFLGHSELEEDIAKVQAVKKSFLHKFWKVSGREIVREVALRKLEEVCFPFLFLFVSLADFLHFSLFGVWLTFGYVLGQAKRAREASKGMVGEGSRIEDIASGSSGDAAGGGQDVISEV